MINVVCGIKSTGRICTDLAQELERQGHVVKIAYGREKVPKRFAKYAVRIGTERDVCLHGIKARLFDATGFGSTSATRKFLTWVKEYDPDVIHLHNIHGYYLDVEILFDYLRTCGKRIIWTLHDCWAFTGHCAYFDYYNCEKWKTGCGGCVQKNEYPARVGRDHSKRNFLRKRQAFCGIDDMTIVTPSKWLADLVKESYLSEYSVEVIHNGVDVDVFKPTESDVKARYGCENKRIVLGVAAVWDRRKGLDAFIKIAEKLEDNYRIILVGLEKSQTLVLPENIIPIERTNNTKELAELYSAADVFVNPTLEDNYPTTNIEAIACGTPVITYDTGGSGESARYFGMVVEKDNVEVLLEAIKKGEFSLDQRFDVNKKTCIKEYISLYER